MMGTQGPSQGRWEGGHWVGPSGFLLLLLQDETFQERPATYTHSLRH